MAVLSVTAWNWRKNKNIHFDFKGKTVALIGDSETGKSSIIEIIKISMGLEDFKRDALSKGEEEGGFKIVHEWDGIKYTISRPVNNKKGEKGKTRFTVVDEKGGRHTLETLLESIFGKAFVNSHFDYYQYFYEQKSPEARFNYMVKACGQEKVLTNLETIARKRKERGKYGTQRETLKTLINDSPISEDPEQLMKDMEYYAEPKTMEEADQIKKEILDTRDSVFNITTQLNIVKKANQEYKDSEIALQVTNENIAEIQERLRQAIEHKEKIVQWQADNEPDFAYQTELEEKLSKVEKDNEDIEKKADIAYSEKLTEVNTFNQMRASFEYALVNFEKWTEANDSWNNLDTEIKDLGAENTELFKKSLPVPGLSFEETEVIVKGEPKNIVMVMYDGLELTADNISKGRSIRLAIDIQKAINPGGNHIVIIPEAQSLGSQVDEILEECKRCNVQAILEITERKQPLHLEFEEEFLGTYVEPVSPAAEPKKKRVTKPKITKKQ